MITLPEDKTKAFLHFEEGAQFKKYVIQALAQQNPAYTFFDWTLRNEQHEEYGDTPDEYYCLTVGVGISPETIGYDTMLIKTSEVQNYFILQMLEAQEP